MQVDKSWGDVLFDFAIWRRHLAEWTSTQILYSDQGINFILQPLICLLLRELKAAASAIFFFYI